MKKKLFTFALCIIMVAAIAVPAFAAEPPQWSEGDTTVIDLTYEEFIKKTAELNGISEEEAVQLFEGIRKNSQSDGIAPYADLVDHYQVVSKTFTYSKNSTYSATSEATLWLRGKGSYFQIQGVVGSATRIQIGTSTASWVQLYNNYNASFPSLSVDFVGSGHFTESRTHSGGGSVNINGFNLTGSTAYTDTYSSDTMSLIWTYKLYA